MHVTPPQWRRDESVALENIEAQDRQIPDFGYASCRERARISG
jgi:hypothetical protein